jgi:TrmH family RNA methyltransferase
MTELPAALATDLSKLNRKKERLAQARYLIEGERLVDAACAAAVPLEMLIVDRKQVERYAYLAKAAHLYITDARHIAKIADTKTPQGIIAIAPLPTSADDPAPITPRERLLILDGVSDPGNVGTLIRTAAWYQIDRVICGPDTADPYSPKVVRATMGGLWATTVGSFGSAVTLLDWVQRSVPVDVYTAELTGQRPADVWRRPGPPGHAAALVMGSEAHGLQSFQDYADRIPVTLPGPQQRTVVESLNAGVAGAILLHCWSTPH